eukprot:TRINITY_DN22854_c0_g1_i4.p2 TRINITY_DN22854_c0_g1~~TRINITY_DN22854_c0_g1_i4.p2  ORF type:complete len:118 (-),score=20.48 TRINITY_DN22854_c0_g1_i4:79-432(-)
MGRYQMERNWVQSRKLAKAEFSLLPTGNLFLKENGALGFLAMNMDHEQLDQTIEEKQYELDQIKKEQNRIQEKMDSLLLKYHTVKQDLDTADKVLDCLLYTSPSPRDLSTSRMPSSA